MTNRENAIQDAFPPKPQLFIHYDNSPEVRLDEAAYTVLCDNLQKRLEDTNGFALTPITPILPEYSTILRIKHPGCKLNSSDYNILYALTKIALNPRDQYLFCIMKRKEMKDAELVVYSMDETTFQEIERLCSPKASFNNDITLLKKWSRNNLPFGMLTHILGLNIIQPVDDYTRINNSEPSEYPDVTWRLSCDPSASNS